MEVTGKQDLTQVLTRVNTMMALATDALFGNSTAIAAVQVRKKSVRCIATPHACACQHAYPSAVAGRLG